MSEGNFENISVDDLLAQLKNLQDKTAGQSEKIAAVKTAIAELSVQMTTLARERTTLENEIKADVNEIRQLEKELEKARRLQAVKDEQDRIRKEFEEKAKELDELTKSAKWREFAFDHQIEGGKRLAIARRGILGDKRGLGKTLSSLIWCDMVRAKRVLVLAPNDVVPQFEEEIRSWAPSRTIFSLRGMPKGQRDFIYPMLNMVDEFIITLNYEAWRRDKSIIDDLVNAGIDTVICDEAHRIKSSDKVTARGVFQIAYRPNYCPNCDKYENYLGPWEQVVSARVTSGIKSTTSRAVKLVDLYPENFITCRNCGTVLTSTVKNLLCMTGTPILNKPQELFSMLFLVDRKKFPAEKRFLNDYCYSAGPNRWRFLHGGLDRLTNFMSEFFLQRTREDAGITVPPPAITVHTLEKDLATYAKQYEAERILNTQAALLLEDGTRKDIFYILEMILRARQVMTWPAGIVIRDPETKQILCKFDVEESQKLDAAEELLEELCEEEERIVVFSQFKGPLYEMKTRLEKKGVSVAMATGDQTDWVRQQIREDFDLKSAPAKPKFQVCLATYKAFGTGINLNAARHMILIDDEWSPGNEDQAIGRIDRLNSVDQANVHIFRVKNSIDDFMAALLEEKRKIVDGFESKSTEAEMRRFFLDT